MNNEHCMCPDCLRMAAKFSDLILQAGEIAGVYPKDILDACVMTITRMCMANGLDPIETIGPIVEWCATAAHADPEAFEPQVTPIGQA